MGEAFNSRIEKSSESAEKVDARVKAERAIELAEVTRDLWIENVRRLEEVIPHDDILVGDSKTLSYNVLRNAMLKKIELAAEDADALRFALNHLNKLGE